MPIMQRQTKLTDYEGFVEKFKPKKTTDDCYTPAPVFEAIARWVREHIPDASEAEFVRPFYPGGDYEAYDYPEGCVVVDNPPFSILSKIVRCYIANGVRFFLFAPHLTMFNYLSIPSITAIVADAVITYENGAQVNTGFLTNVWPTDAAAVLAGSLKQAVADADKLRPRKTQKKVVWPANVTSSALLGKCVSTESNLELPRAETAMIRELDNGQSIFGGGLMISDRLAAELRAAELRAAELRAAELRAAELRAAELRARSAEMLSDQEKLLIQHLNRQSI